MSVTVGVFESAHGYVLLCESSSSDSDRMEDSIGCSVLLDALGEHHRFSSCRLTEKVFNS